MFGFSQRRACEGGCRLLSRFAALYGEVLPGWAHMATVADRLKNSRSAQHWAARHLAAQPDSQSSIMALAHACYQRGDGERAFHAILAKASDRPVLLAPNDRLRRREIEALQGSIEELLPSLRPSTDSKSLSNAVDELRLMVGQPSLIKAWRDPNSRLCAFLKDLTSLEELGDLDAAFELIQQSLESCVGEIRQPRVAATLFYRAAEISAALGQRDLCVSYLEEAIWADKLDPMLLAAYRTRLREYCRPAGKPERPRTCIAVVSCEKNWEIATALAQGLTQGLKRDVFVVRGERNAKVTSAIRRDFGFEVVVPNDDGYGSLPNKLTLLYRYIAACTNSSGLLKLDDDCVVRDQAKFSNSAKFLRSRKSRLRRNYR